MQRFEKESDDYQRRLQTYQRQIASFKNWIIERWGIRTVETNSLGENMVPKKEEVTKPQAPNPPKIEEVTKPQLPDDLIVKQVIKQQAPIPPKVEEVTKPQAPVPPKVEETKPQVPVSPKVEEVTNPQEPVTPKVEEINSQENVMAKPEEPVKTIIERLNQGNSQKNRFDFGWNEDELLNYADDSSLEMAYRLIERGKIALSFEKPFVVISSHLDSFCKENLTNEDFFQKCEGNEHYKETKGVTTWKTKVNTPFKVPNCCETCQYQSCPKRLAAYILYLKNNGLLLAKLAKRDQFRQTKNEGNGFFLFDWQTEKGLKNVKDDIFQYAMEMVKRDYVKVERTLDNQRISIKFIQSCKHLQLTNLDITKMVADGDWNNTFNLRKGIKSEATGECQSYTCRFTACTIGVAGYIYYLMKNGQEAIIQEEREYYHLHQNEIDQQMEETYQKKIRALESKKNEKIQNFIAEYEGKIENLQYAINGIMQGESSNLHVIVAGEDEVEKKKFIAQLIKLLQSEKDLPSVRRISLLDFSAMYCHLVDFRINKEEKIVYADNDIEGGAIKTFKRDKQGIPYASGTKIVRKTE